MSAALVFFGMGFVGVEVGDIGFGQFLGFENKQVLGVPFFRRLTKVEAVRNDGFLVYVDNFKARFLASAIISLKTGRFVFEPVKPVSMYSLKSFHSCFPINSRSMFNWDSVGCRSVETRA